MFPLQNNIEPLANLFQSLHSKNTNATVLKNYIQKASDTNEITRLVKFNGQIVPEFMNGIDQLVMGKCITGKEIRLTGKEQCYQSFNKLRPFWGKNEFEMIEQLHQSVDPSNILEGIFTIAHAVVKRIPKEISVVCGPVSSTQANVDGLQLAVYKRTVDRISHEEDQTLNLLPFLPLVERAADLMHMPFSSEFFCKRFYKTIFSINKNWKPAFIHGWENYPYAVSVHEFFSERKIPVRHLQEDYHLV